jgi:hypothetical protein
MGLAYATGYYPFPSPTGTLDWMDLLWVLACLVLLIFLKTRFRS